MRMRSVRLCVAIVFAALFLGALPVSAKPAEQQDYSLSVALDRFFATLTEQSERALENGKSIAALAIHSATAELADITTEASRRIQDFRDSLNEPKAKLDILGKDAAAWLIALTQETTEAVHRFPDRLKTRSATDEPTQIPI